MAEKEDTDDLLLFEELVKEKLAAYKIPLILVLAGIIFLILAFYLAFGRTTPSRVEFISSGQKEATSSAPTKIKADIEGAVMNPGVYDLLSNSRVSDLLIAAGGLSAGADRNWVDRSLNRAAKLVDGGKIYIPAAGEMKTSMGEILDGAATSAKININTASVSDLDKLPGVGQVTAEKIISGRPYGSVEELKTKKSVNNATYEKIKEMVETY